MPESRFEPVALPELPFSANLQAHCLSCEDAWEDYPWGEIVYKVGSKIFTFLGVNGALNGVTVKATLEDADFLCQLPHIERARYVGKYGWVSVKVEDEPAYEHARELIAMSYELVRKRPKRASGAQGNRHV